MRLRLPKGLIHLTQRHHLIPGIVNTYKKYHARLEPHHLASDKVLLKNSFNLFTA